MTKKELASLYLHFPFCRHLCNYCDFYKKIPNPNDIKQFESFLKSSWEEHEKWIGELGYNWSALQTFYLGGGTPSLWGEKGASFLGEYFAKKKIVLDKDGEHTMEVNPGTFTPKGIKSWQRFGMNRFSIGMQSLNKSFLKKLDRVHTLEDSYMALDFFDSLNVNFSVDFMLGLPDSDGDQKRDIINELNEVLSFKPKHISLYILTVKKNYVHFENLPSENFLEKEYLLVADFLKANGFQHYEVSNFSLPGYESQHNLKYWNSDSVAALGKSATGLLAQDRIRYKWKVGSIGWEKEVLSEESFKLEKFYMALRINKMVVWRDHFSEKETEKLIELGDSWEKRGLVDKLNAQGLNLNSRGFLVLDSLLNEVFSLKLD